MKQKFYDSDILTDNPPSDMHSEHDLPKDKLFKKKLIYKEELFRVYREIRSSGESYVKPASYDETTFKLMKLGGEEADEKEVESCESRTVNIGLMEKDPKWLEIALTKMKKGEICVIMIEHLKYD